MFLRAAEAVARQKFGLGTDFAGQGCLQRENPKVVVNDFRVLNGDKLSERPQVKAVAWVGKVKTFQMT